MIFGATGRRTGLQDRLDVSEHLSADEVVGRRFALDGKRKCPIETETSAVVAVVRHGAA